jgi:ribosomal protein RSM22 (predicted rRNA methylase)
LVAWEREPVLIRLGRDLAQGSVIAPIRSARWQRVDVTNPPLADQRYDLVLAGHLLNELDPAAQHALVDWAWEHTAGVLLLVEPGTSVAFPFVLAARDHLRERGAYTIAPCTHDHPCPLQNDWCHFPQRIMRPAFQRRARDAPSPWEESKFAYAAMARFPPTQAAWGRVIREPSSNKAYAEAMISTAAGVQRYRALKRHRDAYRLVRNVTWGALLETRLGDQSIEALEG